MKINIIDKDPVIAQELSSKNELSAEDVIPSNRTMMWWVCSVCGKEWEQSPKTRFYSRSAGPGCPDCRRARRKLAQKSGTVSLVDKYPRVYEMLVDPDISLLANNTVIRKWYCRTCDTSWSGSIEEQLNREDPHHGPYCTKRTVSSDLTEWLEYWSEDNPPAETVSFRTTKEYLWNLPDGTQLSKSPNDVADGGLWHKLKYPVSVQSYADLWSPTNNDSPIMVGRSSKEAYLWDGECGHQWSRSPFGMNKVSSCPECDRRNREEQKELLETQKLRDQEIARLKRKQEKVQQKLDEETRRRQSKHETWKRRVAKMQAEGTTLRQARPNIADQVITPVDTNTILATSTVRLQFQCEHGHTWDTSLRDRVRKNSGCPVCSGHKVLSGFNDLETRFPDLAAQWHPDNPLSVNEVSAGSNKYYLWLCDECGGTFSAQPNTRTHRGDGCPNCSLKGTSNAEQSLAEFVSGLVPIMTNVRGLLGDTNYEVDIWIPSHNIGIEFNGLHWHQEKYVGRDYHAEKSRLAEDNGIALFHIWEDQWRDNRTVVENVLQHKLGLSDQKTIGARQCTVATLTADQVKAILEDNHLQGFTHATRHFGLIHDEVVAVMSIHKRKAGEYELTRFASSTRVPGGFSKLLKHAIEWIREDGGGTIVTFSDNSYATGQVYQDAGFTLDRALKPDYSYVVNKTRQHKFLYRKKRFEKDPNLKFEPGLTERELAAYNSIPRIYDAGKKRWILDIPSDTL